MRVFRNTREIQAVECCESRSAAAAASGRAETTTNTICYKILQRPVWKWSGDIFAMKSVRYAHWNMHDALRREFVARGVQN